MAYYVNIWGLVDPVGNREQDRMLSDQQVTNILRHLETCHGLSREEVNRSHLPQGEPPFPGMLAPFVHEMNVNEEAFLQKITVAMYVLTSNKMKNIGSVNNRYVCIMLPHYSLQGLDN